ncbi:phosphoenolpyruvate carboxylase [Shewanella algae]|uniref:phosphoenolpyruvate carboxylase n=1 Tax=Shewanella algae TaxID=38313 RepID=UPI000F42AFD1|nr:phosphoenolpyruvate carboxylase [Shewanella algae]AYV12463.1 phosphoenolpyruvate carboxylase [Shewanella algae]MBO2644182.1 phosphoenolpyruvate carboxylase [Shewanella algae]QNH97803.1 phosphoenolpyruvate carboxylase [Shewanella algae]
MSSNLHQAGVKLLRLLGRNAELVMDAYLSGSLDETRQEPALLKKLTDNGILWRPEPDEPLRLSRNVRALLEEGLKDERNRQINANVGSALATIKTLANHYREARASVDYSAAEAYLADLTEHVFSFTESLRYSIRVLWGRINNEFGYVGSINAKIRENELAQSQVSELLNGLELFEFTELGEIAGDIRELRRLLVTMLQDTLSDCTQELSVVQGRLLELLGRFRQIRGRTRLLKGWLLYTDLHPDYQVADHVAHKQVPVLFNHAEAMLAPASVDVNNSGQELQLMEMVARIKAISRDHLPKRLQEHDVPVAVNPQEDFDMPDNPLKEAVDEYFCAVIDSGRNTSALEYLQQQQLSWDPESWLYQVIGGFEGLSEEHKRFFALEPLGEPHPLYSGNFIIRDVEVGLR